MQVTSTTYMDFLMKTGLSRFGVVKTAHRLYNSEFKQGFDYYRQIRMGIIRMLRTNGGFDDLWAIVEEAPAERRDNFASAVTGFESWMKGKGIVWGSPPQSHLWRHADLEVLCNPELLMNVNGDPFRIKLYFKAPPVTQRGANLVIHLHEVAGLTNENLAVLDVRRGKSFRKTYLRGDYDTVLQSEALSFAAMWHALDELGEMRGDASSS
jgi:hypothetical protein